MDRNTQPALIYLERVLRVVQAVDPDVILHGGAGDGAENGEFEALGGCGAQGLAHEAVCAQRLRQDVAGLVIHLDVARRGEILLSYHHHILQCGREERKKKSDTSVGDNWPKTKIKQK